MDLQNYQVSKTRNNSECLTTSIVESRLDYCITSALLYGIFAKTCRNTESSEQPGLDNRITRMVLIPPSAETLLKSLYWLPVVPHIQYKIVTLKHRALTTRQPPYLSDLSKRRTSIRTTRSADMELLAVPDFRLELARRAFHFAAPTV